MLKIHHFESFQTRSKLENKIEKFFKEISELKNREIVTILKNDFEIVMVYLNTGKIWEAFLKKDPANLPPFLPQILMAIPSIHKRSIPIVNNINFITCVF